MVALFACCLAALGLFHIFCQFITNCVVYQFNYNSNSHMYIDIYFLNVIPFRFVVIRRAATRTTTTTTNTEIEQCAHATLVPACRASAKRLKARAGNEWTMEFRFSIIHAGRNGRRARETRCGCCCCCRLLLLLWFCVAAAAACAAAA